MVAESDPERMMSHTESWRSQLLTAQGFELQKPLFAINTYTDKQVRRKINHVIIIMMKMDEDYTALFLHSKGIYIEHIVHSHHIYTLLMSILIMIF